MIRIIGSFFLLLLCTTLQQKSVAQGLPACPSIDALGDTTICSGNCTPLKANVVTVNSSGSYSVSNIPYVPFGYSGTPILVNIDDIWSQTVNLGFNFCFFGNTYSTAIIGANGQLCFNTALANSFNQWVISSALPSTADLPGNTICAAFRDIDPSEGGNVYFRTEGTAPCRRLIISWVDIPLYSSSCASSRPNSTFQMVLYESTNYIDVYIQNSASCSSWNSGAGIIGIQNATGTTAVVPPGRNYPNAWNGVNLAYRFKPTGAPQYTIDWTDAGGNSVGTGNPISVCPTSTTTYTALLTVNGCGVGSLGYTDYVTVNVVSNDPVSVTSDTICKGNSATLTASGATSYSWSPVTDLSDSVGAVVVASPGTTTNYTVYGIGAACPGAITAISTVLVHQLPPVTAGNNGPLCSGDSVKLSSSGGLYYAWSGPNGFSSALEDPVKPIATTADSGNYIVTAVDSFGCTFSDTTLLIVHPLPAITISSNSPVCLGNTLQLNADGGGTYLWSGPNGFTSDLQNPVIASATSADSGRYSLIVQTPDGCIDSASIDVIVAAEVPVTIVSNDPICDGATLQLSVTSYTTYSWTGPNGFSSNVQSNTIDSISTSQSGQYAIYITDAAGCTGWDTISITVNPLPTANISSNSPVCITTPIELFAAGGATYSWSGPNGFSDTLQNPIKNDAQFPDTGIYTVTVASAAGCTSSATTTVAVLDSLDIVISANDSICYGGTITLNVTSGVSYDWSGPNGWTANSQYTGVPNVTDASSGEYIVNVTDSNGCISTATTNIIVNPLPVIALSSNSPVCENQTITLNASGGITYAWSGPNGFSDTIQAPVLTGVTLAEAGFYSVLVTTDIGCTATDSLNVVVNALPGVNVASNGPVCVTYPIELYAAGGVSYSWTGPNGFISNLQNPVKDTAFYADSGNYIVTVGSPEGCFASDTTFLQVNSTLVLKITANEPVCLNGTLLLTLNTGTTFSWTGPNGFSATTPDAVISPVTDLAAGTYTVVVSDANGCTNDTSIDISINPLPTISAVTNSPVCENQTLILTASGGISYSWLGPNGFTSTLQNENISPVPAAATGQYTVLGTDAIGCSNSTVVDVVINPKPVATTMGDEVCVNESINLSVSGGVTYAWTGPNGFVSTDSNLVITNAAYSDSGIFTVVVTDALGCTVSEDVPVSVHKLPLLTGTPSTVCIGERCVLHVSGANTYLWTDDLGQTTTGDSVVVTSPVSVLYTVTGLNSYSCVNFTTIQATINPLPVISITPKDISGCDPLCIDYDCITSSIINSYSWNFTDSTYSNVSKPNHCFYWPGSFRPSVKVTDVNGCISTDTGKVTVYPKPIANFTFSPETANILNPEIGFKDSSFNAPITSWYWTFSDNLEITSSLQNPYHFFTDTGNFFIDLYITSDKGCTDTVQKSIYIEDIYTLYVPNAFTPSNGGANNEFKAAGVNITYFSMRIYDRWGNLIFETDDIKTGWNGRYKNTGNKVLEQDVYVWQIDYKSDKMKTASKKAVRLNGTVALIR